MVILFSLPRFDILNYIKKLFLIIFGAKVGKNVVIYPGVWIKPASGVVIGDNVDLAKDVLITANGGVSIGDRTLIGYRTQILSINHIIPNDKGRIFGSGHSLKKVTIGHDVWIGANCLILPGVSIGNGSVIAAGSIVTKSIPEYKVVAGVPARVIKDRN